jgi:parallel beta-helix repeat protein
MKFHILLSFICLMVFSSHAFASSGTCNSCADCTSKFYDYDTVVLSTDIVGSGAYCVSLFGAGIDGPVLDCNGHSITGQAGSSVGVKIYESSSTGVQDCVIRGFDTGILLDHTSGTSLTGNSLYSNNYGIKLLSSQYNMLLDNEARGNQFYDIYASSSSDNIGYDNTCDNTYGWNDEGASGCTYGGTPDLTLSSGDITFSTATPKKDQRISITARIHNNGNGVAENVLVKFFDGPPTNQKEIGHDTINEIKSYDSEALTIVWKATSGSHIIYVSIDPANTIIETNEQNNIAQKSINVKASLKLVFVPVNWDSSGPNSNFALVARSHFNTFNDTLSAETNMNDFIVEYDASTPNLVYPSSSWEITCSLPSRLLDLIRSHAVSTGHVGTRYIGISNRWPCPWPIGSVSEIFSAAVFVSINDAQTMHELGHSLFYVCDEYARLMWVNGNVRIPGGCPNPRPAIECGFDCSGEGVDLSGDNQADSFCVMGKGGGSSYGNLIPGGDCISAVNNQLTILRNDPEVYQFGLRFFDSGNVVVDNVFLASEGVLGQLPPGDYTFRVMSANGSVLYNTSFSPVFLAFTYFPHTVDSTVVVVSVPVLNDTYRFSLLHNGTEVLSYRLEDNCSDTVDNDGDGLIDCADVDCYLSPYCNNVFFTASPEKHKYDLNETVCLSALLAHGNISAENISVSADVIRPDNLNDSITLFDDGLHGDGDSGDGIYANNYSASDIQGMYNISFIGTGIIDNYSFIKRIDSLVVVDDLPDIGIFSGDIYLSDGTPVDGVEIGVTAVVHNLGRLDVENITLAFFDAFNTSSTILEEKTVEEIQSSESINVSILWNASTGSHQIGVLIDPYDQIYEYNESNNIFNLSFEVLPTTTTSFTSTSTTTSTTTTTTTTMSSMCFDGVKNNGETGVDCGSVCGAACCYYSSTCGGGGMCCKKAYHSSGVCCSNGQSCSTVTGQPYCT